VAAQTKELTTLNVIAAAVSSSLDLKDVLDSVLDKTLEVMEIGSGGVYLLDEGSRLLNIVAQRGYEHDEYRREMRKLFNHTLVVHVA
jgi:signal transduction protein with GAF and PtsI domain